MITAAPSASALAIADRMNSELTGWMSPSTVAVSMMGVRSAAETNATVSNDVVSSSLLRITPPVWLRLLVLSSRIDPALQRLCLARVRIQRERPLNLRSRIRQIIETNVRVGKCHARGRRVAAPDRDLQRIDGVARTAAAQVDSPYQEVRLRLVGRQEHGLMELRHRLAILLLLVQPAAALEMELCQVLLVVLRRVQDRLIDRRGIRRLQVLAHALEPPRQLPPSAVRVPRRELAGQLLLAAGLDGAARDVQRCREHEMRVSVGGIAAQRFAQPVDRPLRIAIERVGVAEIEEHVG